MSNRQRINFFHGEVVTLEEMDFIQEGRRDAEHALHADYWRDGILRDPNGLSNFAVTVDGTTATLINVGHGTAYANGYRIAIDADQTYVAGNPYATVDGVCVPQSTGNRGIPLVSYNAGVSNFVWLEYLETSRSNPRAISVVDGSIHYPYRDDGYRVVVTTANPPGNNNGITNAVYLATVFGQGAGNALVSAPTGITNYGGTYASLLPKDALVTDNYRDRSVSPQKLKIAGENFEFDGACFTTLVASSNATVPLQPLLPTSAASRRFGEYAAFGVAVSKAVFYPRYDGNQLIIDVGVRGSSSGTMTPFYDGLCNIVRIVETIDGRTVSHEITYQSVDGVSQIYSIEERGV